MSQHHETSMSSLLFETVSSVPRVINKFLEKSERVEGGGENCLRDRESLSSDKSGSESSKKIVQSSFPRLWKFSAEKTFSIPCPSDWLAAKRKGDGIGDEYWRVHDKLYKLDKFIEKHPGGTDWIEMTRGTDITEAFEASHVLNVDKVESILSKYYAKEATHPRNSPYVFKDDGFYKTLKRRVEPLLKKVGTGPTNKLLLTQDCLAVGYIIMSLVGAWTSSFLVQISAGVLLGMCVIAAHNFLHIKDSWRKFYFDLCPLTSYDFRITHALSHHLFPNTILDYEVLALQPLLEFYPTKSKSLLQRYGSLLYVHLVYTQIMGQDILKRIFLMCSGKTKPRPENLLIFIQLFVFMSLSPNLIKGFLCWFVIFSAASYWLSIVGFNAAHHHPACFHDGDEPRPDPDFGLCQLDATLDKADEFHQSEFAVLTTFGEHPLHHLFPAVCHSKLKLIKPIFEKTLEEFLETNRCASQLELFLGTHTQLARTEPWPHEVQRRYRFGL